MGTCGLDVGNKIVISLFTENRIAFLHFYLYLITFRITIMKKYVLLVISTLAIIASSAQETKKIGSIHATFNNQHPDKFILEDDQVKITFAGGSGMRVELEVYNKTDKSMDFLWNESYFVLNGRSAPVHNVGISSVKLHAFHTEDIDVNKAQKIGAKSSFKAAMGSNDKYIFNLFDAERAYKESGETLVNRVVPTLLINGEKKEYPITIELYTKKNLKERKKG